MSDVTLTNAELLTAMGTNGAEGGLIALSKRAVKNIKASYAITKALRMVDGPMKDYEAERGKLVDRFCAKDADGKPVMLDENRVQIADQEGFQAAFNELLAVSVTLPGVRAVTVDELEGCGATPMELLTAGPFVTES